MKRLTALVCVVWLATGCSDSSSSEPKTDGAPPLADGQIQNETGVSDDAGQQSPDQGQPIELPEVPVQSGVVYIGHFFSGDLRIYRTDGPSPVAGESIDMGAEWVTHDMALDPYNDLLAVVHDTKFTVDIYRIFRPTGPDQPVQKPELLSQVVSGTIPLFARIHPQRKRLYIVASPPTGALVTEYELMAVDLTDPAMPKNVAGSPFAIPPTVSLALDAPRDVLFVVASKTQMLHAYDLHDDGFEPLDGGPLDLQALYPQENQTAFGARELTADPYRNRLYAARAQGAMSELIVLEYPAVLPAGGAGYGDLAKLSDLTAVADPFDVDQPPDVRPNLLGAYQPAVDLDRGHIFLSADAWMGSGTAAIVTAFTSNLQLAKSCEDFEGFGCWYRGYFENNPGSHLNTDGALCVDYTHKVVVGTSINPGDETEPGVVHLYRYQDDLVMSVWLDDKGSNLPAGNLPVAAVCH